MVCPAISGGITFHCYDLGNALFVVYIQRIRMPCAAVWSMMVCVCCRWLRLIFRRTFWITFAVRCRAVSSVWSAVMIVPLWWYCRCRLHRELVSWLGYMVTLHSSMHHQSQNCYTCFILHSIALHDVIRLIGFNVHLVYCMRPANSSAVEFSFNWWFCTEVPV